ncbi:ABC transporter substrate-binding protein [Noviherbaspirillum denitrificans]|uniref:ABC transporter substrate-binding protein n=1 Tax=Noviherbaspirillum denitrificans TaxID=1968433 RepID=UPI000B52F330|nr:ABC transporter substrate-binding protein [Noviherbaspirillum denitrificans]
MRHLSSHPAVGTAFLRWLRVCLVLCAWCGVAQAQTVVRIASTAFAEAGKTSLSGSAYRVQQEGWLEQELKKRGIGLEWFPVTGDTGATINEAFAGGRIDFAAYGDLPSIILNAGGVRTHVVVPAGRGSDQFLLVPPGSTAKSIHDLKGKRISIHRGRPWELGLLHLIRDNGLSPKDFRLINMEPKAGTAALATGGVDALFMINGYPLEDKGVGRIIWTSKGKPERKMRAELWARKDFTQRHPEVAELVVTAWLKAQYWASQDGNREAVIKDGTRNGTPESVVRRSYDDPSLPWKERWTPVYDDVVYGHYRRVVAFAHEQKLIRKPLVVEDLLEPRFVNAGLKNLGLGNYWSGQKVASR